MIKDLRYYILLIAFGFFLSSPLRDNDLFWHLSVGRWIVQQGMLPLTDHWTVIGAGQAWVAYSWLFELFIGAIERVAGLFSLVLLQLMLAIIYAVVLARTIYTASTSQWLTVVLTWGVVLGSAGHFALRPQSVVWILYAVLLSLVATAKFDKPVRMLFAVALIFVVWGNIHLSASIGLLAVMFWQAPPALWPRRCGLVLTGTIASMATPYGADVWRVFFETGHHAVSHSLIAEFQSASLTQYPAVILLMLMMMVLLLNRKVRHLEWGSFFVLGAVTIAAVVANKFIPFALITAAVAIAISYQRAQILPISSQGVTGRVVEGFQRLSKLLDKLPVTGFAFLIIAMIYVKAVRLSSSAVEKKIFPPSLILALKDLAPQGTVLTSFGLGGYVGFALEEAHLSEQARVAYDGRTTIIPTTVWSLIDSAERGNGEAVEKLIEQFNPVIMVWPQTSRVVALAHARGWRPVFRSTEKDSTLVVLKKN